MPWQETSPMDQRLQFMADHQRGHYTMRELCARYAISRKTGYKWLARYEAEGAAGLAERSHAPHVCPHRIADAMATLLLDAPRAPLDAGHRRASRVRARVSRVRPPACDPDRQRRPLRQHRAPRPHAAQRLVAAARDPAPAHSTGLAPGERRARADASHAQGGN